MLNPITYDVLRIDLPREADRIASYIKTTVAQRFQRRGAVVALSGGIDSSCVAGLCVRALGAKRVFGLHLPEGESAKETVRLSTSVSTTLGMESVVEDITSILEAAGCYRRRDDSIRRVVPEYGEGYKSKIVLPSVVDDDRYRIYSVVVEAPDGEQQKVRLDTQAYLGIVAATNCKQRTRKMLEYYHGDRLNYAVSGTPNRLEYDQGFFVKGGDGLADFKPIAHLYKTQVYEMARYLGLPEEVCDRPPTTDTYSLAQSQEEFYFTLPYDKMDLCLYAKNHGIAPADIADAVELAPDQIERVFRDIDNKRASTRYLHAKAALAEAVDEIGV